MLPAFVLVKMECIREGQTLSVYSLSCGFSLFEGRERYILRWKIWITTYCCTYGTLHYKISYGNIQGSKIVSWFNVITHCILFFKGITEKNMVINIPTIGNAWVKCDLVLCTEGTYRQKFLWTSSFANWSKSRILYLWRRLIIIPSL